MYPLNLTLGYSVTHKDLKIELNLFALKKVFQKPNELKKKNIFTATGKCAVEIENLKNFRTVVSAI